MSTSTINNNEVVGESNSNNNNNSDSSSPNNLISSLHIDLNNSAAVNWKIISTSNTPTPRFDNTLVYYKNFIYSYGGSDSNTNSPGFVSFLRLDLESFQWQTLACPLRNRIVHTSVIHENCMYVFGGGVYEDERTSFFSNATAKVFKTLCELWRYNLDEKEWTLLEINQTSNPENLTIEPRDGHCSVVVDDEIYIIGGSQTIYTNSKMSSNCFTNCKVYNISTNTWRQIPAPSLGRLGSAVYYKHMDGRKCIYFYGGYGTDNVPSPDLWRYDIKQEKWSLVKYKSTTVNNTTDAASTTTTTNSTPSNEVLIPESRFGHSANVFQDKMLVYGGYSKKKGFLRDFYSFDFDKDEWKQIITEGPPKRRRHSTVLIENYGGGGKPKLFLYGGTHHSCIYNDFWEYSFPSPVPIPSDNLVEDFSMLFTKAKEFFSDVTFNVEGKQIHAHRNILSVRSPYFKSLFSSGLKETYEKEITINERHDDFKTLIEFLYSGNEQLVELENCIGILYLADLYCVPRLKTVCESKATEGIECETVVNIFKEADNFKLTKLRKLCLNFMARNHKELVKLGLLNDIGSNVLLELMDYMSK
ncbi:hypothetical protein DICPUDRAFT_45776 [Dictyostelium purpureum]|uniref:BTB domain-containing protein n=1 Tax=Dictyostelium purpureum TaxID=5786 RepID=F0ZBW7_DICPU|nr:uncharacterized protein DICPUDRAFT_45776 [Dictyostelium purpureum]EGC38531.1 hypothetical protein DICPUDRAFT_45776 [Dictyostelium purpureum]|eukprot:XP_003284902.1 hypothetical protein DICPUDRAFT_45776 [Dictyostelium purpureum]